MPPGLSAAHEANDRAVPAACGLAPDTPEPGNRRPPLRAVCGSDKEKRMQIIKPLMKFFKKIFKKVLAITCGSATKSSKESSVKPEPIESEFSKLARDGRRFDRGKLDAMLVKLSESPTLEVPDSPSAMCYSISIPKLKRFEYVCPACGTHTIYGKLVPHMGDMLIQCRQGVEILRAKGLDITLDESPLCMKCRSAKELNIPTRCKIVKEVEKHEFKFVSEASPEIQLHVGDIVEILECASDYCYVSRIGQDDSEAGLNRRGIYVPIDCIGDLSYDEVKPSRQRVHMLSWIINGKSVAVSLHDVDIMMTFLKGEEIQYNNEKEGWPLKCDIDRLCDLLGSETVKSAIKPLSAREIFIGGRWRDR